MGSSAKTGKKFFEGHQSTFWIKMQFGIGHPPPTHQLQSTCVGRVKGPKSSKTEFYYLDLFKSYGIFSDFVVPVVPVLSPSSPHHPHSPQKVPMAVVSVVSSIVSVVSTLCCPRGPRHPHVVPIIPMSSLLSPHHPRVIPIIPT